MSILKNKVAIITGSSRGIGKAIALCFAGAGCKVVVNYHCSRDKALEVAQEIEQRIHGESLVVQADVSKPDDVERMVTEAVDRFGKIDILVNNAGLAHPCGFLDVTLEEWNRVIDVNLTGAFICSQMILPIILQQGWGRIINIASTSGMTGGTSGTPYAAAKGGVMQFVQALALETAPYGVNVNAIGPTFIATEMTQASLEDPERYQAIISQLPLGRPLEPDDLVGACIFLASRASDMITGHLLMVDAGHTIH